MGVGVSFAGGKAFSLPPFIYFLFPFFHFALFGKTLSRRLAFRDGCARTLPVCLLPGLSLRRALPSPPRTPNPGNALVWVPHSLPPAGRRASRLEGVVAVAAGRLGGVAGRAGRGGVGLAWVDPLRHTKRAGKKKEKKCQAPSKISVFFFRYSFLFSPYPNTISLLPRSRPPRSRAGCPARLPPLNASLQGPGRTAARPKLQNSCPNATTHARSRRPAMCYHHDRQALPTRSWKKARQQGPPKNKDKKS